MDMKALNATLFATILLISCGDDNPENATDQDITDVQQEESTGEHWLGDLADSENIVEQALEREQKKSAASYPCSLFTVEEVQQFIGGAVDPGFYTFEHMNLNDDNWRGEACAWSSAGGEGADLRLWVSRPENFDDGKVRCIGLTATDNAEPELGAQSSWTYQSSWGWGTLRICAADRLMEVEIRNGPRDEQTVRAAARSIAQKVLQAP